MSDAKPPSKRAKRFAKLPDQKLYAVGHSKPPEATQFKPGQSGNPKGRPKGKKHRPENQQHERLKSIILEEAYRTIKVNDGGKQIPVPMAQAVMRSLAVTAAKGNTRAQKLFSELLTNTELSNKQADDEWLQTMIEYKANWDMEIERRKLHSINLPDPLPHPDDIIVDYKRNTVSIRGPMDKREQTDLDLWLNRKNDNETELKYLENAIKDQQNSTYLSHFESEIIHTKRILDIISTALAMRASQDCIQRRLSQLNRNRPVSHAERFSAVAIS
jgi:hypothetical protein